MAVEQSIQNPSTPEQRQDKPSLTLPNPKPEATLERFGFALGVGPDINEQSFKPTKGTEKPAAADKPARIRARWLIGLNR